MTAGTETVEEVIRKRQRVVGVFGMYAQTACNQEPVEVCTHNQTNGDPSFIQTAQVNGTGQTHQKPTWHIGSTGRHRGHERAQAAAAEDVVVEVAGWKIGGKADQ